MVLLDLQLMAFELFGLKLSALEQSISFGDGAVWLLLFRLELSALRQWFMLSATGSSGFEAVEVGAYGFVGFAADGIGAVWVEAVGV
jgi:hypothetical protein